ncbi:hypothetical protein EDB85DRAFT_1992814 [Lactarius pseudohatsudake]|nr:hypothetical protein EDB85DRAFT_1992814 [Lactarius pseudohatsudake]
MPSIGLVRRTVRFDSRGSGFWVSCPSRFFTEMLASYPRVAINVSSANLRQIKAGIIDSLLADTPAFAVGLLGFAVLTFFLILKKVNLASLYLLSSVLLTFFGAVTDLGIIYLRHTHSTDSPTQRLISSLTIIREVLYSIASGLRFLFYWVYVSRPPLCEQGSARFLGIHSGCWLRWGVMGSFLRWTTLAASLSVPVLQILWRTVYVMHEFGPVYDIEGAMEITTSAIFIIKLLLNVFLVEASSRRQTLYQYSSVVSALLINMGIGVGNLIHFAFSEMTLGRLLLAVEFHILVVSIMVFAFHSVETADGSARPSSVNKRASSFRGLRVSFYDSSPGPFDPNRTSQIQSRPPSVQSISSWLGSNARPKPASQFRPTLDERKRSRVEKSERELSTYPSEKAILSLTGDMIPDSEQSARWDGPIYPSSAVNSYIAYPFTPIISEGPSSPALPGQLSVVGSVYYDASKASLPPIPGAASQVASLSGPDSPVLGSDAISTTRRSTRSSPALQPRSNASFASSGVSDYEILFREQIELERSIAALRESAPFGRRGEEGQVDRDTMSDLPERTARESSTTGNGHTSVSGKSDFSLSIFPEPPHMEEFEGDYRRDHQSSSSSILPPPPISIFSAGQGIPTSSGASDDGTMLEFGLRTASVGTRYDVTSFIGDLSSPDETLTQNPSQPWISDTESEPGSAVQATIVTVERKTSSVSRPRLVRGPSLATDTSIPSISRRLGSPSARGAVTETPAPEQFPRVSTLSVSPPPAIYTRGVRPSPTSTKRVVGLPPRPKLNISPPADRQIEDVLDTPVPGPVPVVTQGP